LGIVIGINPSVGLTTLLVVMVAWAFGLNQVASQLATHAVTPLHLLLFIPFIELGVHLFHTRNLPLNRRRDRASESSSLAPGSRYLAVGMACTDCLGPRRCNRNAVAMYIRRALVLLMRRHRTLLRSRPALR
jgi:hypothetical protein